MVEAEVNHTFVVDRARWLRGETEVGSLLLDANGCRCCLGFFLASLGAPDVVLRDMGIPSELRGLPPKAAWLTETFTDEHGAEVASASAVGRRQCSPAAAALMAANDDPYLDPAAREEAIVAAFLEHRIACVFEGEGQPLLADYTRKQMPKLSEERE